jgi:hypothetical protein
MILDFLIILNGLIILDNAVVIHHLKLLDNLQQNELSCLVRIFNIPLFSKQL